MTIDDVIEAFNGQTALAADLGVTVQAIGNMKARGAIPSRHWAMLVKLAAERSKENITFEALAAITETASGPSEKAHAA